MEGPTIEQNIADPPIRAPSLQVSVSKTGNEFPVNGPYYEELKTYREETEEVHRYSNELKDILNMHGAEQLHALKDVVNKSVSDAQYRECLANDTYVIENLVQVLKQTITRMEPIYNQMSMPVDALRMDTGSVDEHHQKRLYIVKWSLIHRILNIIKNLLVSNHNIQQVLYRHKVLLQMVKLIPKAMVAREITVHQGAKLLGRSNTYVSSEVPRELLQLAVPICSKTEVTLITFFLNSIAGSKKMQNFIRPQLWSGPMAILAMTIASSRTRRQGNMERYAKDLSHYVTLFHTLFVNVTEIELADWWELEESPLWNPKGELGHVRTSAEKNAAITNSLQRTATNLSMQLSIPGWNSGASNDQFGPRDDTFRPDTVVGALMEPQTSSVQGKGVHMDRMKSFKVIADKPGGNGSLGLNGREALLIILTTVASGLKVIEREDVRSHEAHEAWDIFIRNLGRRGGFNFWHAFFRSFKKCRAVSRILKAISLNKVGPRNPITLGTDEHHDESIYYLMADGLLNRLTILFHHLDLDCPRNLTLDQIDDVLLYYSEDMNIALIRACISEVLINEVVLKVLADHSRNADDPKVKRSIDFLMATVDVENGQPISFIRSLVTGSEENDNAKLYLTIKDNLESEFSDHPSYQSLIDGVVHVAEHCDHHDPLCQISSGSVFRIVIEMMKFVPDGDQKNILIGIALSSGFRWLRTLQHVMSLEAAAANATKAKKDDSEAKTSCTKTMRRHLICTNRMSATLALEMITTLLTVASQNPHSKAIAADVCVKANGVVAVLYCTNVMSEDEPTIRERATLALAGIAKCTEELD